MSSRPAYASPIPIQLWTVEVRAALIAWTIYFSGVCAYCLMHQAIVSQVTPDLAGTVVLALREWGVWLISMPIVFRALSARQDEPGIWQSCARVGSAVVPASLLVPLTVDAVTDTRGFASTTAIFLPRYAAVFLVVCLAWHVFLRRSNEPERQHSTEEGRDRPNPARTLLVSKGADECLIQVDRVQYVSAAGNYVEVVAGGQVYLMRGTMKQVEELLPAEQFMRIHRSHIVNLQEIERMSTQRSGHGSVHLRCGKVLSMSKSYRAELRKYRSAST